MMTVPLIMVPAAELARLREMQPGLVVDCSWCDNAIEKKPEKQIAFCDALGCQVNTGQLRICSSFVERK